ncbi:MAG: hypothetical protein COV34_00585 [Candidatus Zambryskibacteria bacterium CG10_big_fil_rev_8_21_14_0_10_42_12]|uniref:Uncharacterized protein n=1 Tax=Candidatus Zambryskibacteria bacterium CG10_big_fil_rev_8_21_14_0_10_42_12 TaxID=1975115 RepID=A0A2H0QX01_9BACT|nr:MAG: hypothetical protein COV34_00585 [Candidatus Zambryskibacteria bacterium CG10_big_fil_rev_8_21_14_0_10_42_12]
MRIAVIVSTTEEDTFIRRWVSCGFTTAFEHLPLVEVVQFSMDFDLSNTPIKHVLGACNVIAISTAHDQYSEIVALVKELNPHYKIIALTTSAHPLPTHQPVTTSFSVDSLHLKGQSKDFMGMWVEAVRSLVDDEQPSTQEAVLQ